MGLFGSRNKPVAKTAASNSIQNELPAQWSAGLHRLWFLLQPLGTPEMIGRTFGAGSDLHEAVRCVEAVFPEPKHRRGAGQMMVNALDGEDLYDIQQIMGTSVECLENVDDKIARAATSLLGAAITFMGEPVSKTELMHHTWFENDEVVSEFMAWHCVAFLRLVSMGRMPSPDYKRASTVAPTAARATPSSQSTRY